MRAPIRREILLCACLAAACDRGRATARSDAAPAPSASASAGPNAAEAPQGPILEERFGSAPQERRKVTAEASAMGTRLNFVALTSSRCDEPCTQAAIQRAIDEIRRLEDLMTTWREDSEVSRINAGAGRSAVAVGPDTLRVIEKSLWISRASGGVFDITFEAMHGLWRFDHDLDGGIPDAAAVAARRKLIDYRHVRVDAAKSTVLLDDPRTRISLGGIAKGYAVDRAAAILLAAGLDDFLAQAGGDLYVHGVRVDGSSWTAGVRDPRGPEGSYFARMAVRDHAFSTAGDYERSFIADGKRYHHIIDPRTGYPATASRSVTIWAKDALTADALDDAVFILGPAKGLALVESIDDAGAIIVDRDNRVIVSRRLDGKVIEDRTPTDGI
jgi:thiamine biosynthesis lipoprotein